MTKTGSVLNLMQDGKPRSLSQIEEESGCGNLSSQVTRLYQTGRLWASDIQHIITLRYSGKWKWSRARTRWYIIPKKDNPARAEVIYEEWDKTARKNVLRKGSLEFKQHNRACHKDSVKKTPQLVLKVLQNSAWALFPDEIAERLKMKRRKVTSALFTLSATKRVHKSGWVKSGDSRRERVFDRGWLYYVKIEQLSARVAKRDMLTGTKQLIYETIRKHTEIHRQFVRLKDLAKEMGMNPKTVADNVHEAMDVYVDLKQIEVSGDAFYYIENLLAAGEFELEKRYWETEVSERCSYKNALGHSHEQFCQLTIDMMDEKGDFKIGQPWWEFVIKNGKKRYQVYKPSIGDPKRRYEYDRILHIPFPLGKNELTLVFEAKYRGTLGEGYYRYFNEKLADTQGFGCVRKEKDIFGHEIQIRAIRHNVIPVFVIPAAGRDNVDLGRGHLVNFAQYIVMQGCLLVFTQEFERYLQAKFHRNIDFQKQFDAWYKTGQVSIDYTKHILEYLGALQSHCC
jgi:hypothetical protein